MSDFRWSSMVRLIHWLLMKNGFPEDQADAIIDKLRSELRGFTAEDNGEIRLALAQRLARYITRLELGDGVSPNEFENRYQHNYLIILGIFTGGIILLLDKALTQWSNRNITSLDSELHYEIGNVYLGDRALDRAIEEFDRAIELNPIYAEAFNSRGVAYSMMGQYNRAIADFDQAIKLNPNYVDALSNRGHAFNARGEYDRAIQDLNDAIKLNPHYAGAWRNRGNVHNRKRQYNRAIEDYNQAIKLNPANPQAFGERGDAHFNKGEFGLAIADFDQAIKLDPNNPEAFYNRGITRHEEGRYDRAIEDYNQAIRQTGFCRSLL
jgi:tetratricopeptide (TPR) repeat protein